MPRQTGERQGGAHRQTGTPSTLQTWAIPLTVRKAAVAKAPRPVGRFNPIPIYLDLYQDTTVQVASRRRQDGRTRNELAAERVGSMISMLRMVMESEIGSSSSACCPSQLSFRNGNMRASERAECEYGRFSLVIQ